MVPILCLRKNLEDKILSGHPWIFRNALADTEVPPGKEVIVQNAKKRFLCRGITDAGPIGVRVFATENRPIDQKLFKFRMQEALALRSHCFDSTTNAFRLLHGEGDLLPGVVCDLYGKYAVLRFDGEGIWHWRDSLIAALSEIISPLGIQTLLLRSAKHHQTQIETCWGKPPEGAVTCLENGIKLLVDLLQGQKTGMFLDHRESRSLVRRFSPGLRVLNLFGYTGAFSVAAGLGGALEVTTVDMAKPALLLARENWSLNSLEPQKHLIQPIEVKKFFEQIGQSDPYDLIICDPPSFAPNQKSVPKALRAYLALHSAVLQILKPGGLLLAASCSSHISRETFEKNLLQASLKTQKRLQILGRFGAAFDHPNHLAFPEGDYLKVALARVVSCR